MMCSAHSFVEDSVLGLSQLAALDPLIEILCSALVAEVKWAHPFSPEYTAAGENPSS